MQRHAKPAEVRAHRAAEIVRMRVASSQYEPRRLVREQSTQREPERLVGEVASVLALTEKRRNLTLPITASSCGAA